MIRCLIMSGSSSMPSPGAVGGVMYPFSKIMGSLNMV